MGVMNKKMEKRSGQKERKRKLTGVNGHARFVQLAWLCPALMPPAEVT